VQVTQADGEEVVLLRDASGDYYIVARDVIDRGKLEGDLKDTVAEAVEGPSASFSFGAARFEPISVAPNAGASPAASVGASTSAPQQPFSVIGTFTYVMPAGVNIAGTLRPGL
jgi:hypothetical protein